MTLPELNRIISGNYTDCPEVKKGAVVVTQEEVKEFINIFSVNDYIRDVFNQTENYIQFYDIFPWFKKVFPAVKAKELFYAAKCEMIYEGVPPTVVFLLKRALANFEYTYVNLAISRIERKMLSPYMKVGALSGDITFKDVIENIIGKSCKLITDASPCIDVNGVSELYVTNIDAVALVPTDMLGGITSLEDFQSVEYDKAVGLKLKGQLIRTMNGKVGITKNDLDLRGCL